MRSVFLAALLVLVPATSSLQAGPYDEYKSLTSAERRLVLRYFWQVLDVRAAAEYARLESEAQYPQLSGQDDPRDAFRHSLWNGTMVRRLGSVAAAERWGTAHESDPANPPVRKAMDLFNNEQGRARTWARRTTNGPWWNRTRLPDDASIRTDMLDALRAGDLRVIEEVAGTRDPHNGRLVPSYAP